MKFRSFEEQENALRNWAGLLTGKDYTPWIKVQHISSKGFSSKIFGLKTGRVHHFLSLPERYCFLLCEHNTKVIDIREQFPLLPIELTQKIADKLHIKHPTVRHRGSTGPFVMTTDLFLTKQDGNDIWDEAISVKKETALKSKRKMELQEIEHGFFQALGIKWTLFVETKEFITAARNLDIFTAPFRGAYMQPQATKLACCLASIVLGKQKHGTVVAQICNKLNINGFEAQRLIYFLIVNHLMQVDLTHDLINTKELIITSKADSIANIQGVPLGYIA